MKKEIYPDLSLKDGVFKIFDHGAILCSEYKLLGTGGYFSGIGLSSVYDIKQGIETDLCFNKNAIEEIDHILVNPYYACLLFLSGRIKQSHVKRAIITPDEIIFAMVYLPINGRDYAFKVKVCISSIVFGTVNKSGEFLKPH